MSDLTDRLRGIYKVGDNGEYGTRSFSDFVPPISLDAANRIDELENGMRKFILAGFMNGYEIGHNDTVESAYGDSEETGIDWLNDAENDGGLEHTLDRITVI